MKKAVLLLFLVLGTLLSGSGGLMAQKHYKPVHKSPKVHSNKKKVPSPKDSLAIQNGTRISKDSISEPGSAETKDWIIKKISDFKPTVFFTKEKEKSQSCEWKINKVSFLKDKLLLILVPQDVDGCLKNVTATLSVEFTNIDSKKTSAIEGGRKVYLYAKINTIAFSALFEPSLAAKTFTGKINFIYFSFDNLSSMYETSLCTRLAKAFNRLVSLKTAGNQEKKEAF